MDQPQGSGSKAVKALSVKDLNNKGSLNDEVRASLSSAQVPRQQYVPTPAFVPAEESDGGSDKTRSLLLMTVAAVLLLIVGAYGVNSMMSGGGEEVVLDETAKRQKLMDAASGNMFTGKPATGTKKTPQEIEQGLRTVDHNQKARMVKGGRAVWVDENDRELESDADGNPIIPPTGN